MKAFADCQYATPRVRERARKFCSLLFLFMLIAGVSAHAQTFGVIHTFSGGGDGYQPAAGVTVDQGGNLYGTTSDYAGPGTVFQMKYKNGSWILNTLLTFNFYDGIIPQGRPVFGPGGAIYGTTTEGGGNINYCGEFNCGAVYSLRPSRTICHSVSCPWTPTLVYAFTGPDGNQPYFVDPVFDSAGNIYGTTTSGGPSYAGNVFQLTRSVGGGWTATSIHDFNITDGLFPVSGVVLDATGNIYGMVEGGGAYGPGAVYRLSHSGSGWTYTAIYSFTGGTDGSSPIGGLVFDQAGNLYGTTATAGAGGGGTVFELSPSGGDWNFTLLYSFSGSGLNGPYDSPTLDSAGNLYGTTYGNGAFGYGSVFKLTHNNGSWIYTDLHDFTNGNDGGNPIGGVSLDANGNLFGTTVFGGNNNNGVVWKTTP
jgi:uncharacterized repeat protein (TIGR03803 family)